MICKYFLPDCRLSFHFLDNSLWCTHTYNVFLCCDVTNWGSCLVPLQFDAQFNSTETDESPFWANDSVRSWRCRVTAVLAIVEFTASVDVSCRLPCGCSWFWLSKLCVPSGGVHPDSPTSSSQAIPCCHGGSAVTSLKAHSRSGLC